MEDYKRDIVYIIIILFLTLLLFNENKKPIPIHDTPLKQIDDKIEKKEDKIDSLYKTKKEFVDKIVVYEEKAENIESIIDTIEVDSNCVEIVEKYEELLILKDSIITNKDSIINNLEQVIKENEDIINLKNLKINFLGTDIENKDLIIKDFNKKEKTRKAKKILIPIAIAIPLATLLILK